MESFSMCASGVSSQVSVLVGSSPLATPKAVQLQPSGVVHMTLSPSKPRTVDEKSSLKPILLPYELWNRKSAPKKLEENKLEVCREMEPWAAASLLPLLKPVEQSWQPQDYLPDFSSPTFHDEIVEIQQRTANLPDDYMVVLVGDMVTEEALPTYQTLFNTFDGVKDPTACSPNPWAQWVRGWTAEENRHGDLLSGYLYMSGRINMRQVQKTTQYLIGAGMASLIQNDPYNGFIYTSFQERATWISHLRTAEQAKAHGDNKLAVICKMISADEKRHEIAYTRVMSKIFELDPNGATIAFEDMMKKKITMPAHLMFDGQDDKLFDNYAAVAQRLGVYTALDYVEIMEHLIGVWKLASLEGLSSDGMRAQEFVCNLPPRFRKLAERAREQSERRGTPPARKAFSWIFNKEVVLF